MHKRMLGKLDKIAGFLENPFLENYDAYHFVLVVDADPVLEKRFDNVEVAFRSRPLQCRVSSLKMEKRNQN